jgi:uncharacterized protein YdaU (DUF1376 family)
LNYYPHHIGDYLRDTAHLTALEDGTYRRMLDVYYASEKPLPLETQWVCRLVRARTPDEQEAVQEILRHYFEKRPDGWHNKRADEEIARGLKRIKTAKLNGKKGGRKKTQRVSENNPAGNPVGSQPSLAHQKPKAKSQREIVATRKTPLPDGFSISERVREWAKGKGIGNLEQHLEHFIGKCKAKDYRYVDWDEGFMGAIRDDWAKLGSKPAEKVHYDA